MAVIESPETVGIRPFHEFDEANATWPRGRRLEAIRSAADDFRDALQGAGPGDRGPDRRPGQRRLSRALRLRRRRAARPEPVREHPQPPRGRAFHDFDGELRTLVWEPTVPEGSAEAPVLRPADRALRRVAVRERALEAVQHGRGRPGELRPGARRRGLRGLRPPARAGHADPHGHHAARGAASASRASRSSRTPGSSASARRWTRWPTPTRCSGPGTCPAAWTT